MYQKTSMEYKNILTAFEEKKTKFLADPGAFFSAISNFVGAIDQAGQIMILRRQERAKQKQRNDEKVRRRSVSRSRQYSRARSTSKTRRHTLLASNSFDSDNDSGRDSDKVTDLLPDTVQSISRSVRTTRKSYKDQQQRLHAWADKVA